MWCSDCDAVAVPRCYVTHSLCALRPLVKEAEAALAMVRAERSRELRRLAEDVRCQHRRLTAECAAAATAGQRQDLAALREMLAIARKDPLHLLKGDQSPLHRALSALRREAVSEAPQGASSQAHGIAQQAVEVKSEKSDPRSSEVICGGKAISDTQAVSDREQGQAAGNALGVFTATPPCAQVHSTTLRVVRLELATPLPTSATSARTVIISSGKPVTTPTSARPVTTSSLTRSVTTSALTRPVTTSTSVRPNILRKPVATFTLTRPVTTSTASKPTSSVIVVRPTAPDASVRSLQQAASASASLPRRMLSAPPMAAKAVSTSGPTCVVLQQPRQVAGAHRLILTSGRSASAPCLQPTGQRQLLRQLAAPPQQAAPVSSASEPSALAPSRERLAAATKKQTGAVVEGARVLLVQAGTGPTQPVNDAARAKKRHKSRSVRAPAAVPGGGAGTAAAAAGMESLPDELLVLVLAAVPLSRSPWEALLQLRSLRLVCRRWSRLALSAEMWRRRELVVEAGAAAAAARLLRLVPALGALTLRAMADTALGDGHARAVLQAATKHQCRVRSLECHIYVTNSFTNLFQAALLKLGTTLEEIRLFLGLRSSNADASPMFAAVEDLRHLKKLSLSIIRKSDLYAFDHTFRKFHSLEELTLHRPLHFSYLTELTEPAYTEQFLSSLLSASRTTLLRVDCGDLDIIEGLLECPGLKELTLDASKLGSFGGLFPHLENPNRLDLLCRRTRLETLDIMVLPEQVDLLLNHPQLTMRRIRLHIDFQHMECKTAVVPTVREYGNFSKVTYLDMDCYLDSEAFSPNTFFDWLASLPRLEVLIAKDESHNRFEKTLSLRWTKDTAPRLRVLHVKCCPFLRQYTPERHHWAPRLQRLRPNLTVCSPLCDKRHL